MFDDYYGLTGKPFQLTPDPAFYFESITHRKALSYLGYGLAQGEGFIVITGEVGAGKSTLVAHLVSTIDPEQLTIGQIVTSKLDEEEIIHVIAQCFGLAVEGHDKASALGAIESFLHGEARAGRRSLLIVDESQNLSVEALEELRMLSNFQLGSHPLLQILLLGQPEFRATLQGHTRLEQLRQRVIAAHHLEPMQAGEIQPYVEHRLKRVGWSSYPTFDEQVFAALHEASGGIPRRVNQIANRLMLLGAVDQRDRIDVQMLDAVLAEMAGERSVPDAAEQHTQVPPAHKVAALQYPEHRSGDRPTMHAQEAETPVTLDATLVENLLAERDALISELQQAVVELSRAQESVAEEDPVGLAELSGRLEALDERMSQQESAIKHTLTMLIEWIESDGRNPLAA